MKSKLLGWRVGYQILCGLFSKMASVEGVPAIMIPLMLPRWCGLNRIEPNLMLEPRPPDQKSRAKTGSWLLWIDTWFELPDLDLRALDAPGQKIIQPLISATIPRIDHSDWTTKPVRLGSNLSCWCHDQWLTPLPLLSTTRHGGAALAHGGGLAGAMPDRALELLFPIR